MLGFTKRAIAVGAAAIMAFTSLGSVALAADLPPTLAPGSTVVEQGGAGPVGLPGVDVPDGSIPQSSPVPEVTTPSSPLPSGITPDVTTPTIPADALNSIDMQAAMQAAMNAVANKLGMSTIELMIRVRSGQTLADLAKERGVGDQEILTTVAEAVKPQVDQAVQEGKLTQAVADQIYQQILQAQQLLHTPVGSISLDQLLAQGS